MLGLALLGALLSVAWFLAGIGVGFLTWGLNEIHP